MSLRRSLARFALSRFGIRSPPLVAGDYMAPWGEALGNSVFNTAWLTELGISPKTIIDVGAYDGGESVRFKTSFPDCRVVAVEADAARFRIVRENCSEVGVEAFRFAIQSRDGPVSWYAAVNAHDGTSGAQGSIYRQSKELDRKFPSVRQSDEPLTVGGCRLDTLCNELGIMEIDLLHMDIQGAEHAALLGLGKLRPKVIFLEAFPDRYGWKGSPPLRVLKATLANMGYRLAANFGVDRLYVHSSVGKG